jgi:hypothetical protein
MQMTVEHAVPAAAKFNYIQLIALCNVVALYNRVVGDWNKFVAVRLSFSLIDRLKCREKKNGEKKKLENDVKAKSLIEIAIIQHC